MVGVDLRNEVHDLHGSGGVMMTWGVRAPRCPKMPQAIERPAGLEGVLGTSVPTSGCTGGMAHWAGPSH